MSLIINCLLYVRSRINGTTIVQYAVSLAPSTEWINIPHVVTHVITNAHKHLIIRLLRFFILLL